MMALSTQEKFDMIRDMELRIAKELLAEQYIQNIERLENSQHPMTELKAIAEPERESQVVEIQIPQVPSTLGDQDIKTSASINDNNVEHIPSVTAEDHANDLLSSAWYAATQEQLAQDAIEEPPPLKPEQFKAFEHMLHQFYLEKMGLAEPYTHEAHQSEYQTDLTEQEHNAQASKDYTDQETTYEHQEAFDFLQEQEAALDQQQNNDHSFGLDTDTNDGIGR